jgi:hypothetical protein
MTRMRTAGPLAGLLFGGIALLAACGGPRRTVVYVPAGPPAEVVETQTPAPGPNYVWIAGYHTWNGTAYVWTPGHWERSPAPGEVWVPGHWRHNYNGWYWVPGHWR